MLSRTAEKLEEKKLAENEFVKLDIIYFCLETIGSFLRSAKKSFWVRRPIPPFSFSPKISIRRN